MTPRSITRQSLMNTLVGMNNEHHVNITGPKNYFYNTEPWKVDFSPSFPRGGWWEYLWWFFPFDGSLGVYPHEKVHINLLPGLELVHHRVYSVPHIYEQTFKKELQHMADIGILEECSTSERAMSCFNIPKMDGCVRQISHLWSHNVHLMQKYLLPVIHIIMHHVSG